MTAEILFDARFPHGSPQGFRDGCTGSACPSVMPCHAVYVRYQGDFVFRRRMDSGLTLAEIADAEAADRARDVEVRKLARKQPRKTARRAPVRTLIDRDELRRLHGKGLTDRQIAGELGLNRRQVTNSRQNAGLSLNPDERGSRTPSIDSRLHEVAHLTVEEAAAVLGRAPSYVRRRRQIAARKSKETA